jgi:hypothetical protein
MSSGMRSSFAFAAAGVAALALAGCEEAVKAPYDKGVCFHMVTAEDGTVRFNRVAVNQPSLEYCAARLELMRRNFMSLGSPRAELTGSYQGRFLFIKRSGIWTSEKLNGGQFLALQRTADGRLAIPGAFRHDNVPREQ